MPVRSTLTGRVSKILLTKQKMCYEGFREGIANRPNFSRVANAKEAAGLVRSAEEGIIPGLYSSSKGEGQFTHSQTDRG